MFTHENANLVRPGFTRRIVELEVQLAILIQYDRKYSSIRKVHRFKQVRSMSAKSD